ncbi:demethoxyubiquinone hydroxylase family protein [Rickettsiales endosymbiont of Stachyamoeba lipophora]|uniref:demethoxyubiquinone hydroxylase family protein n=1 Tax=Rickettsiales endosymbiont of Stachyamoeba lipophora TaxID=2486578 RepID=UPI000F6551A4|nr:demethoxyubiquinone hydroxylase family protein [Rickettsiales endosymbiont of Stachyamoeba lipophora]AZL15137.1 demethoxyubiquinone hydroxylase family protein [Rickettsiales endosymbiont of Stachyamoeba lipophora]
MVKFDDYLPGDKNTSHKLKEILRVNHAGEYGAKRIYEGQLKTLGDNPEIKHMYNQELEHLQFFEQELIKHNVRPSILSPLWHIGGYMLGRATSLLGEKAAMACTEAVEEVIDEHYSEQIEELKNYAPALSAKLEQFRQEELEHRDLARKEGATEAPCYSLLNAGIKTLSKIAIRIAKKY